MKIYISAEERQGPRLRFVEQVCLEYNSEQNTIYIYYTDADAVIAARIAHTINYHTEGRAEIYINNQKINIKTYTIDEIDNAVALITEKTTTISIKLLRNDFLEQNATIMVAANTEKDAM
jgi:hypothetical protein